MAMIEFFPLEKFTRSLIVSAHRSLILSKNLIIFDKNSQQRQSPNSALFVIFNKEKKRVAGAVMSVSPQHVWVKWTDKKCCFQRKHASVIGSKLSHDLSRHWLLSKGTLQVYQYMIIGEIFIFYQFQNAKKVKYELRVAYFFFKPSFRSTIFTTDANFSHFSLHFA